MRVEISEFRIGSIVKPASFATDVNARLPE